MTVETADTLEAEWRAVWERFREMMRTLDAFIVDPFTVAELVKPEWAKRHPGVMADHAKLGSFGASKGWLEVPK